MKINIVSKMYVYLLIVNEGWGHQRIADIFDSNEKAIEYIKKAYPQAVYDKELAEWTWINKNGIEFSIGIIKWEVK